MDPKDLRYATTHEWASLDADVCTIGITKFAVEQLGDIVYVELPDVGDHVFQEKDYGEIESVKAVSPLVAPVSGEVIATNDKLESDPQPLVDDPYGKGWMIKVKIEPGTTLDHLMTLERYEKQVASEGH